MDFVQAVAQRLGLNDCAWLHLLAAIEPLEESTIKLRFGFIGGEIYTAEETAQELRI